MLFTLSSLTPKYRMVTKDGRDFMVVPGVPIQEQVLNSYLVPGDEIAHFVGAWNGVPVTIEHPKANNGSANTPEPDVAIIGRFYNAAYDEQTKKLSGEYWLDVAEAMRYPAGQAIINAIKEGRVLENSTGYFADEEQTPGQFNGVDYQTIHRNLRPDHIALLPDKVGACSVMDGCGVNRNEIVCQNCSRNKSCSKTKPKEKNMKLQELLAMLKGKGFKVEHNETDESFVVEAPPEPVVAPSAALSVDEVDALKKLALSAGAIEAALVAIPAVTQVAQNVQAEQAARRAELVASIKANSSLFGDDDLAGMTLPQLTKLNTQTSVNYAGLGGGYAQQNATEALGLPDSFAAQKEK